MFALSFFSPETPGLAGRKVQLRPPTNRDYEEWAALRGKSRSFLEPWEPRWTHDELDRSGWRLRLRRYRQEISDGTGYPFFIYEKDAGRLVGGISLGNVRYGVSQSCHIGYWMGEAYAGRGYMQEAVGLVAGYAFDTLKLHRVEAACIPGNERSIRVLEKAGFRHEGLLRSYLKINGRWHDHLLFGLIAGDDRARTRGV